MGMKHTASKTSSKAIRATIKTAEHNARKRRDERLRALMASNGERIAAINEAIRGGKVLRITTGAFGDFEVALVNADFVAYCYPPGSRDYLSQRMFHFHAGYLPEWEKKLGLPTPAEV